MEEQNKMEKIEKRCRMLEEVTNNIRLLNEMLSQFDADSTPESDMDTMKVCDCSSRLVQSSNLVTCRSTIPTAFLVVLVLVATCQLLNQICETIVVSKPFNLLFHLKWLLLLEWFCTYFEHLCRLWQILEGTVAQLTTVDIQSCFQFSTSCRWLPQTKIFGIISIGTCYSIAYMADVVRGMREITSRIVPTCVRHGRRWDCTHGYFESQRRPFESHPVVPETCLAKVCWWPGVTRFWIEYLNITHHYVTTIWMMWTAQICTVICNPYRMQCQFYIIVKIIWYFYRPNLFHFYFMTMLWVGHVFTDVRRFVRPSTVEIDTETRLVVDISTLSGQDRIISVPAL